MTTPLTTDADDEQLATIRRQLEQQLQERQDSLRELEPRANPALDPAAYQMVATGRRIVAEITAALARIDAGTFGLCTRCQEQIPAGRLEVLPHAATCVSCQS